jgi:Tfp pilus assembly protein PilF
MRVRTLMLSAPPWVLCVLLLVVTGRSQAQLQTPVDSNTRLISTGQLNFRVIESNGKPAVGRLCLLGESSEPLCSDADQFGSVTFFNIRRNTYIASFLKAGQQVWSDRITISDHSGVQFETVKLPGFADPNSSFSVSATELRIPERARRLYDSGVDALHKRQYGRAQRSFQAALSIYPDFARARNALAVTYAQQKDVTRAVEEFDMALMLDPQSGEIHFNYGLLLVDEKKYREGGVHFKRALELKFSLSSALASDAVTYLIFCLVQADDLDSALVTMKRVHQEGMKHVPSLHQELGAHLKAAGRTLEGVDQYQQYVREMTDNSDNLHQGASKQ